MDYTGERIVPGKVNQFLWVESLSRYSLAANYVKEKVVLDVGCGTGYGSQHLISKGAKNVLGIDISEEAISYAKTNYNFENLSFVKSTIDDVNSSTFDVIIAFEIIEHINEQEKFLERISKLLKNDGLFFVSTPNREANPPGYKNPFHTNEFNNLEFTSILKKYFKSVQIYWQQFLSGIVFSSDYDDKVKLDYSLSQENKNQQYMVAVCGQCDLPNLDKLLPIYFSHAEYQKAFYQPTTDVKILRLLVDYERFDDAAEFAKKHEKNNINVPEWNYLTAFSLHRIKKYQEAIPYYNLALQNNYDKFWIRYNLGALFHDIGEETKAKNELKKAISINPQHEGAKKILDDVDKKITQSKSEPNQ